MGVPNFSEPINYWGDVPEFKQYERVFDMPTNKANSFGDYCFKTISEFKECIIRGGEPVFLWNGVRYGVCFAKGGYCIAEADGNNEKICKTPDEVLEYKVGADRLRDVITQVTVIERTI
jgi:hypothetical protein